VAVSDITGVPVLATAGTPLTLTGTVTPSNATNKTIVWTVNNAGTTGATIIGGNVLNATNLGTVTVTATIVNGITQSTAYTQNFTITVQQPESFTITFTQIADEAPEIIGPTIYRSGTNGPRTATIVLANPGQYSFINWYITGTTVSGVEPSFTLNALNTLYNNTGQHFLTVEVVKNGVPYNRTIIFTVAP
jgi:endo-1,4-beta-xylanase